MPTISERLQHAWNAFFGRDHPSYKDYGLGSYYRQDRNRLHRGADRSVVVSVYNQIAMDVAAIEIRHVRVDANDRYIDNMPSKLDNALNLDPNLDQTARAFKQDCVLSMFDEGHIAIVPIDTTFDPTKSDSYDIATMRVGKVTEWYPAAVKIQVYNEKTGKKEEIVMPKKAVAIVENPLYAVMNEPNGTLQRLVRKLALLDSMDEQASSGKLDLIIQLPYVVKSQLQSKRAEDRRKDVEMQLMSSKYGVAYIDGTEKVTQLNRPLENKLLTQIEYLQKTLYNQLGLTDTVFNGTADEATMLNYNNRTIEPIISAIVDEMNRKFLTKTARTQGQRIMFFKDPFRLVPVNSIAEIADKFTRNEIMSSNEIRGILGMKPSMQPGADELRNKNLAQSAQAEMLEQNQNGEYDPQAYQQEAYNQQVYNEIPPEEWYQMQG